MPVPLATYRIQIHAGFGFDDTAAIADYLQALGVSATSILRPSLQAGKGSTHGYDVLNHHQVSKELGGPEGHARLCQSLGKNHLGYILDIVPNHMSIASRENTWWWDVLENGQSSRYAVLFRRRLAAPRGQAARHGADADPGRPLRPGARGRRAEVLNRDGGTLHPPVPRPRDADRAPIAQQPARPRGRSDRREGRRAGVPGRLLRQSAPFDRHRPAQRDPPPPRQGSPPPRCWPGSAGNTPRSPAPSTRWSHEINASPTELDTLLDRQNYRLAYWRTAGQELDYRRFFDINTLVSLRIEDPRVFDDTHVVVLDWVRKGVLDGLRVDHPDGLRDPRQYAERLHEHIPNGWIVVEKILEPGEKLPDDWPVAGTTGYDFLNKRHGTPDRPRRRAAPDRTSGPSSREFRPTTRRWSARRSSWCSRSSSVATWPGWRRSWSRSASGKNAIATTPGAS